MDVEFERGLAQAAGQGRGLQLRYRAAILLAGALGLHGCTKGESAEVAEGCYRFADGVPFFKVTGNRGVFASDAGLRAFTIGPWGALKRSLEVRPGFVIHDGTNSPPKGPARMAQAGATLEAGRLEYRQTGGRDVFVIPVEAYGEVEVVRGEAC